MKIYDCFTFFNELELLDLRLMTLNDIVDKFVLVEANKTHTGKPKEFVFEQNKYRFENYIDKIIYIKVDDLPDYSIDNVWIAENFQRNCIERGLSSAKTGDKIIISDLDEIPNPKAIQQFLTDNNTNDVVVFTQYLFYYYINCLQNQTWCGSAITTYGCKYTTPQTIRNFSRYQSTPSPIIDGGWHYSFMGGAERIKQKVESIAESHIIINDVGEIEDIEGKINTQSDLWNRQDVYAHKQIISIEANNMAPICIYEFIKKYPNLYFGEINEKY